MKQTLLLLQNLYLVLGTRNLVYSPIFRPTLTLNNGNSKSLISPSSASASLLKLRFFTSKKDPSTIENSLPHHIDLFQTHKKDVPIGDDEVTKKDLKMQIEKYLEGDEEAIPSIFEAILKRKLAGKHDESDDELMNEFRQKPLDDSSDREFDSESESD